jgi:hypothetical protein
MISPRPGPTSRISTAKTTSPSAVQTTPSTTSEATPSALGTSDGGAAITNGVSAPAATTSDAHISARASMPSSLRLSSIGPAA